MPAGTVDKRVQFLTQAHELVKMYSTFDAQNRLEFVYTAPTEAGNGDPCTIVQYVYRSVSSMDIMKMKESNGNWDSTWDV